MPETWKQELMRRTGSEAKREYWTARGKLEKFKVEKELGKYIEKVAVEEWAIALSAALVTAMDGLPGRICNELAGIADPGIIRLRLLEEFRSVVNQFNVLVNRDLNERLQTAVDDDAEEEEENANDESPSESASRDMEESGKRKPVRKTPAKIRRPVGRPRKNSSARRQ